jgi:pantothenate kinase
MPIFNKHMEGQRMTMQLENDAFGLRNYGGEGSEFHRALIDLAARPAYMRAEQHYLLGIAGPPLSGAYELANGLVAFLNSITNDTAVAVHMDGFRIPGHQFKPPGKGALAHIPYWAPGSFEQEAFCQFVAEIRERPIDVHVAATYDHVTDRVDSEGIRVTPAHKIVIIQSPYLLYPVHPWKKFKAGRLLDQTWYADAHPVVLRQHYLRFYQSMGLSDGEATRFVEDEDMPTSRLVLRGSTLADLRLIPGSNH